MQEKKAVISRIEISPDFRKYSTNQNVQICYKITKVGLCAKQYDQFWYSYTKFITVNNLLQRSWALFNTMVSDSSCKSLYISVIIFVTSNNLVYCDPTFSIVNFSGNTE